jgi:Mn-containing catalase
MFLHRKETIMPVDVGTPNAQFGRYLLEQSDCGASVLGPVFSRH